MVLIYRTRQNLTFKEFLSAYLLTFVNVSEGVQRMKKRKQAKRKTAVFDLAAYVRAYARKDSEATESEREKGKDGSEEPLKSTRDSTGQFVR